MAGLETHYSAHDIETHTLAACALDQTALGSPHYLSPEQAE